ncbi:DEAD/DEAH box helicase [Cytobacillus spongiae]|uniref:DEAD/DEAH box helicase n=1 Tax=Cytobacillus spongiae TaxID=2901381 RepID=UPI003D7C01DA
MIEGDPLESTQPNIELQQLLIGKQLLLDELPFSKELLQQHQHHLIFREGISLENKAPKCNRCGNQHPEWLATFPCSRCKKECTYCRKCIKMGRVSTCTPLVSWNGPAISLSVTPKLDWSGTLSIGQKVASEQVVKAIKQDEDLLVWAVCGAGKTEVLFQGIEEALLSNKRVCIATPRTDVVLELTPRIKQVFPHLKIASLYGGSDDRHHYSPLTISTTHQLMRFYQAFDVIILDEVDAFPYSVEESLHYAVHQARKPVSSMIYLTATPNQKWQRDCQLGKRPYVTIPARYHRHPLPVPQFVWCGNWEKKLKKGKLPGNVLRWLQNRIHSKKQTLLFLPKIDLMEKVLLILQTIDPTIQSVHAEDPDRKEKVNKMRNKEISLLLTTTILERGVTFPNVDVAVLGAENHIFTESALVQIAGRVGRSFAYPSGNITFFHYGKTTAIVRARKQIIEMNHQAVKRGLVDV